VLTSGFEPETSSLPMKCSTSELCEPDTSNKQSDPNSPSIEEARIVDQLHHRNNYP